MCSKKPSCCDMYVCSNTAEVSFQAIKLSSENSVTCFVCWPLFQEGMYRICCNYNVIPINICLFQVYSRLSALELCGGHSAISKLVTNLGNNHDKLVKEWRDDIVKNFNGMVSACI